MSLVHLRITVRLRVLGRLGKVAVVAPYFNRILQVSQSDVWCLSAVT